MLAGGGADSLGVAIFGLGWARAAPFPCPFFLDTPFPHPFFLDGFCTVGFGACGKPFSCEGLYCSPIN